MITIEEINRELSTKIFGKKIFTFEDIDSTNNFAKLLSNEEAQNGTLIITEHQTKGRGRFNRTWESERGKNLTFTVILTQLENIFNGKESLAHLGMLPLFTAGAISKSIENVTGLITECKWPNDILINNKKITGILTESSFSEKILTRIIIGIGVNVNQDIFSDEIKNHAASLKIFLGKSVNRIKLLAEMLQALEDMYFKFLENRYSELILEWKSRCTMFGKSIYINQSGKIITGIALRLDNDGRLIIDSNGSEIKVLAGDVTISKQ
ncbi:MAG: biotin--[acetyl-CoA-carboxylase] ligase [Bacteroidetes bacterium]|nr:biotin--[acetyl-CoA-carboxylase] ligase [Bacteroidota bacterium]MBU2637301.1 biotin--[acetyl-CoA-carboxylase] ligase [Bacteroidota bacterium]